MEKFLIVTNENKDKGNIITRQLADYIEASGRKFTLIDTKALEDKTWLTPELDVECAIVLGGDGTLIRCATHLMGLDIPILGINLGTVGFLAEIEKHNISLALDRLFADDYMIENRLMLHGEFPMVPSHMSHDEKDINLCYALNDIVITRKGHSRIINIKIYVNDELVDDYRGDGVIISTPTGSTSYNLSAGGPIITHRANVMVVTPICPHSLSPRSVVVSAEDNIKVVLRSRDELDEPAIATCDGQTVIELGKEDEILIKKAQYSTGLIRLNQTSVYEILRSKLL